MEEIVAMMLKMNEEEKKTYIKYLEEKNIEQKEILYKKYQNLRKEREAEQLKDCPFAH